MALDFSTNSQPAFFPWKGQFCPDLVNALLSRYPPGPSAVLLDPFCGSGTTLVCGLKAGFNVVGVDVNPAAYTIAKSLCALTTMDPGQRLRSEELNLLSSLLKTAKKPAALRRTLDLPYVTERHVQVHLQSAAVLPCDSETVDLILTSPPYINVINYHQQFRKEMENMGYDVLKAARGEIGSNRSNRANRFRTIIDYCRSMNAILSELGRVLKADGRVVMVVGRSSKVNGVTVHNSSLVKDLMEQFFNVVTEERKYQNRYGDIIYEDVLIGLRKIEPTPIDLRAYLCEYLARLTQENPDKKIAIMAALP